jgi:hypothetical protein
MVSKDGFTDVVPRFHNIGNDREFASDYFYETDFGKNLILKSSLQDIAEKDSETLLEEVTARWSLLEGAFSINHYPKAKTALEVIAYSYGCRLFLI